MNAVIICKNFPSRSGADHVGGTSTEEVCDAALHTESFQQTENYYLDLSS